MKHPCVATSILIFIAAFAFPATAQIVSAGDVHLPKKLAKKPLGRTSDYSASLAGAGLPGLSEVTTDDSFTAIGLGYDPMTGDVTDAPCVTGAIKDVPVPEGRFRFDRVTDERSMAKVTGQSIGIQAMFKAVSLGGGTSSTDSTMFNSVEQYGRIYARLVKFSKRIGPVTWTDDAKKWLNQGVQSGDFSKFFANCSTTYIRTVHAGFTLDSTLHFKLTDTSRSNASAKSLSAGVGNFFGGSGSFCEAQTDINKLATVEMKAYSKGVDLLPSAPGGSPVPPAPPSGAAAAKMVTDSPPTPPSPAAPAAPAASVSTSCTASAEPGKPASPPTRLQTLVEYYNDGFRRAVQTAEGSHAKPLYIEIVPYFAASLKGLDGAENLPTWPDLITMAVLDKQDLYDDLLATLSEIGFATDVQKDGSTVLSNFYKDTPEEVEKKKIQATKDLKAFQGAVAECKSLAMGKERVSNPDPSGPAGTVSAVDLCQDTLNKSLTEQTVAQAKLTRNYNDPKP